MVTLEINLQCSERGWCTQTLSTSLTKLTAEMHCSELEKESEEEKEGREEGVGKRSEGRRIS